MADSTHTIDLVKAIIYTLNKKYLANNDKLIDIFSEEGDTLLSDKDFHFSFDRIINKLFEFNMVALQKEQLFEEIDILTPIDLKKMN
jgi:hypothetical protein